MWEAKKSYKIHPVLGTLATDGGCKATPPKSLGFMDLLFLFFWSGFLRDSRSFEGLMP